MPPGSAIDPRWSPDGSRIVFMAGPETDPNAWQSDSDQRAIRGRGQDRSTRLR
jgi:Tol biopolymer transport system component